MLRRHIDVIAVSVIALGLLALSNRTLVLPIRADSIRVETIGSQLSGCPTSAGIISRIDQFLKNH
ncbi:MAG TPA: hypothetical protein VKG79_11735 [Bryobacteraceae bacterium]|nr:hypothetical protein [Bryobacteraceae bacterium]